MAQRLLDKLRSTLIANNMYMQEVKNLSIGIMQSMVERGVW